MQVFHPVGSHTVLTLRRSCCRYRATVTATVVLESGGWIVRLCSLLRYLECINRSLSCQRKHYYTVGPS